MNCPICARGRDIGRDPGEIALFSRVVLTADDFAATTALAWGTGFRDCLPAAATDTPCALITLG
jgi:hypothetical protein